MKEQLLRAVELMKRLKDFVKKEYNGRIMYFDEDGSFCNNDIYRESKCILKINALAKRESYSICFGADEKIEICSWMPERANFDLRMTEVEMIELLDKAEKTVEKIEAKINNLKKVNDSLDFCLIFGENNLIETSSNIEELKKTAISMFQKDEKLNGNIFFVKRHFNGMQGAILMHIEESNGNIEIY